MTAGRLNVGIIGAGKVGPVLGRALAGAGHLVTSITAVSEDSRERADAMLPGVQVMTADEVVRQSQLVVFAIPSNELVQLIDGLTVQEAWQPGQIVLHTAPEHGHSVFAPALRYGVIPAAFHPAMIFSGTSLDLARLHEATVAVSAPAPVLPIAQALAVEIGAEPVVIDELDREAYSDAVEALATLSATLVRQAFASLDALEIDHVTRTVASLARGAIDEALLERGEGDPLW